MSKRSRYILIVFVIFCLIYFLRYKAETSLPIKDGEVVKVRGFLSQEPTLQDNKQGFQVGQITIKTTLWPQFHYGDEVVVVGKVNRRVISSFYSQFILVNPQISLVSPGEAKLSLISQVFKLQNRLTTVFRQVLPEPQASLLIGIILGKQSGLPPQFYQALRISGTAHLVVASGMNLSLIVGGLMEFLSRFLTRKLSIFVCLLYILIYSTMTGLQPPIVRAALMTGLTYLSVLLGREKQGLWTLLWSAGAMLVIKPLWLFDVGFQLSFSATLGLTVLGSRLKNIFNKKHVPLGAELAETFSAQAFTMPILIFTFGYFNPLSFIPNVLILWLIPCLMFLGAIVGFSGLLSLTIAQFMGWLAWLPLSYMITVIDFFGK
jgi:competence protein ComEC